MKKTQNQSGDSRHHLLHLDKEVTTLEDLGTLKVYPADMVLNTPDEIPECCYLLKRGRVICYELTDNGEQHVYDYIDPGTLFLEEYLLFDKTAPVTFKTMVESEMIRIEGADLRHAYRHNFDIVTDICESLSDKLTTTLNHIRLESRRNAAWKICRMLLFFAQNYGQLTEDGLIRIDSTLSQQKLADILGMNRVTVTKKLKELKSLGLIDVRSRQFYLPNVDLIVDYMMDIEEGV